MASVREIRDRIKSINDIMKITNAMYLISSSKVKKAKKNLNQSVPYFDKSMETMSEILDNTEGLEFKAFRNDKSISETDKKKAYIVMTADKGLCGAYNHNIIKQTEEMIAKEGHDTVFVMGNIGKIYFKKRSDTSDDVNIDEDFNYSYDNLSPYVAREIAELMIDKFYAREFDEIYIVFTRMISSLEMEPKMLKILPLEQSAFKSGAMEEDKMGFVNARFMPSPQKVMDTLVPIFVKGIIYCTMVEAFCAEQQARMSAMDNATTNSKNMLQDLNLMYNRARQAAITQEITEVVSGAQQQQ